MDDLQAAVLLGRLPLLERDIKIRRGLAERYRERLDRRPGISRSRGLGREARRLAACSTATSSSSRTGTTSRTTSRDPASRRSATTRDRSISSRASNTSVTGLASFHELKRSAAGPSPCRCIQTSAAARSIVSVNPSESSTGGSCDERDPVLPAGSLRGRARRHLNRLALGSRHRRITAVHPRRPLLGAEPTTRAPAERLSSHAPAGRPVSILRSRPTGWARATKSSCRPSAASPWRAR